ncbi:hypothetical protein [Kordiimonas sp.]|uniref:hypothetical protein n=1 Tax=Kordiimonas sp. TaxID=1970157 RepID=UPI003A93872D
MNTLIKITAISAVFALAACGDKKEEKKAEDMAPAAASESSTMDTAKDTMDKVAEALTLDASSLEAFKESLASMKASLTPEDGSKLTAALGKLAAKASDTGGDMMDGAKDMMKDMGDGDSMIEKLYENMADALDGKSFDDIIDMADE